MASQSIERSNGDLMIDPQQFYAKEDHPTGDTKKLLWSGISRRLFPSHRSSVLTFDRRSFVYGIAASFILMFTMVGIYSTVTHVVERSQPQEIKADNAYQSAIREFESVVSAAQTVQASSRKDERTALRKTRLTYLNGAIDELKQGLNSHDLSPLKRQRLLALYNLKLTLLQEMLQQGEIEL